MPYDPSEADRLLTELEIWMQRKIQDGPKETRGTSDRSGHPHSYCVVLIPEWDLKQHLDMVRDIKALNRPDPESGTDLVLVPRNPTKEMLDAAWADALAEDAAGVWSSMIDQHEGKMAWSEQHGWVRKEIT